MTYVIFVAWPMCTISIDKIIKYSWICITISACQESELNLRILFRGRILLWSVWRLRSTGCGTTICSWRCARTSGPRQSSCGQMILMLPWRRLQIFILGFVELTDTRSRMLDAMPCHLQYLCRSVPGSFVRLTRRYLRQIVYLFRQFRFDILQRFQKLLRIIFGRLLTGLLFAQFVQCLAWT